MTVPMCTPSDCSVYEASTWVIDDGSGRWPDTSLKGDRPPGET